MSDEEADRELAWRDHLEDALAATHVALGGDGEWVCRMPSQEPPDSGELDRDVPALAAEVVAERDKLQAFKDWVHKYLDDRGVPHRPPGVHGAEGCRIGDRMDWLMAQLRGAKTEAGIDDDQWWCGVCNYMNVGPICTHCGAVPGGA